MTQTPFPRTLVGGISLPRMLIGSNWMVGYSHTSVAADKQIKQAFSSSEAVADMMETFLAYDIDAAMCLMESSPVFVQGINLAKERTGRNITVIDTPIINVDDNEAARHQARQTIRRSRELGASFCLPHHYSAEQLVNKNKRSMDRLPDYLDMIRQEGMIPGLSAHMPELIVYADLNGYDVETYVQIYNCQGFLMQVEVEYIHKVITAAKKPVMTIKSMAAGRVSPFVGLTFSYCTLRPCDMVTVGCFTREEIHEDVEIAMAALERRPPDLAGRSSPKKSDAMR
ncbi:MAG: hypothetical protein AB9880_11675 [Christensenellales bacterium]